MIRRIFAGATTMLLVGAGVLLTSQPAAADDCWGPGIGTRIDPNTGARVYEDNPRCGTIGSPTLPPPPPSSGPHCLPGVVGTIACTPIDQLGATGGGGSGGAPVPVYRVTVYGGYSSGGHTGTVTVGPVSPVGGSGSGGNTGTVTLGPVTPVDNDAE